VARIKGLPRPIIIHFVTVLGSGANASAVMAAAQESSSVKLNVVGGGAGTGGGVGSRSVPGNVLDEVATVIAKEGFRLVSCQVTGVQKHSWLLIKLVSYCLQRQEVLRRFDAVPGRLRRAHRTPARCTAFPAVTARASACSRGTRA
jgi:hypothetical protein